MESLSHCPHFGSLCKRRVNWRALVREWLSITCCDARSCCGNCPTVFSAAICTTSGLAQPTRLQLMLLLLLECSSYGYSPLLLLLQLIFTTVLFWVFLLFFEATCVCLMFKGLVFQIFLQAPDVLSVVHPAQRQTFITLFIIMFL